MIVKIQRSQMPRGEVMIYNVSNSHWWAGRPDAAIDKWLGDRQKVYAYAHVEGGEFVIDREAPTQSW